MSAAPQLLVVEGDPEALAAQLRRQLAAGAAVALAAPQEQDALAEALPPQWPPPLAPAAGALTAQAAGPAPPGLAPGPALVLGTGGSRGGRRWCVQPLERLDAAAEACGEWLRRIGLEPAQTCLYNPLPLHHVSGLMPLLRSGRWGAELRWLAPELMRDPARLRRQAGATGERAALLSLVPTQLQRLVADPDGRRWLADFAVIWVGGAALTPALAERCRGAGLRLAPCYGSTETGAMVAALSPDRFLAGQTGCGAALPHAALRVEPGDGALAIRATSLAAGFVAGGRFAPLPLRQGWWSSGDAAALTAQGLELRGRLDGAIQSGGDTVFPEQVREQLLALAAAEALPVAELLLLPQPDPLWGERLVALVRLMGVEADPCGAEEAGENVAAAVLERLAQLARRLPPCQRPKGWRHCPELAPSPLGKWPLERWRGWLATQAEP